METNHKPRSLLQRPESSEIEVTDFSFTKPASHKKPFSLRSLSKQTSTSRPPIDSQISPTDPAEFEVAANRPLIGSNTQLSAHAVEIEPTFSGPTSESQSLLSQLPQRMLMTVDSTDKTKIVQVIANLEGLEGSHAEREQSIVGSQPIETTEPARPGDNPETAPSLRPPGHEFVDVCKASGSDFTMHNAVPTQRTRLHRESQEIPDHSPPAPLKPFNNQLRTSMTPNSMEKEVNSKKQMSLSSGKRKLQLSEDDLFEQLIGKIRQREESEKMAANLRRHVETENQRLREVNHTLQDRVKNYQVQLVEISSENKGQRAHIDQWKAKLGTFRRILNEIGREYDKVRQQTKDVREAAMSLGREKVEIKATLDDLKMQVSNQAATIEGQRNKISTSEGTIVALREALEHSEKRGDLIKAQLFSEKKRIVTLENYIQNESQSQARYLTVVKKEQNKMSEKLDSMYDLLSKFPCETQDTILSKIRPEIERCVVCFEELKKQSSSEMMNVESFTSSVQEAASHFNSLAGHFTSDLDRSNEMGNTMLQALQEGLQSIESNFGPYSSLFKQLTNSENCYGSLQRQLQIVEPILGRLGTSVKAVETTETDLIRGLQDFTQMLSEAKIPAGNSVLEHEVATKFAENTQLQLKLQEVSIEVESLRKQVSNKISENQLFQHALTETVTNEQAFKSQLSRIEIERTALRGELMLLEQRIREELTTANTKSQDEMRVKFEHQIHELETAKARLEHDHYSLMSQLANAKSSLAETEKMTENERLAKDLKVKQSESRIDELNESCSKYIAEAKASEVESRISKSSEACLRLENEKLIQELDQFKQRTAELESNLELKIQSESTKDEVAREAERMLKSLEVETSHKDKELEATKERLNMLRSRSAALEKIGEEADAEIVSLLRRAQEAESWQATIREGFAKVMEVHSDEPFERTWQKMEDIMQSLVVQSTTNDVFDANAHTEKNCADKDGDSPVEVGEGGAKDISTAVLDKRLSQTGGVLPTIICGSSKPVQLDNIDSLPKLPAEHGHIVPFSSIHDRLSREDSLSLFNDPAELEMLMMSTPDLLGTVGVRPTVPGDAPKGTQRLEKLSETVNEGIENSDAILAKKPTEAEGASAGRAKSALEKVHDPFTEGSVKSETSNTKRKVVSFEGTTRVITQTDVGRTRRMSDATSNSSGKESESKGMKRPQKRTYSRLRQSVAQEETSVESNINMGSANPNSAVIPQNTSIEMADGLSANQKPPKRSRSIADGSERRPSPKGLASGSSRSNLVGQAANARGRAKRRTRGDRYNQRFSQDAG